MPTRDIIKISPLFNNCAFHSIIPTILSFISPKATHSAGFQFKECNVTADKKAQFRQTQGYRYFLDAFNQYYQLGDRKKAEKHLIKLVEKFSHPLDQQVLLGPVLREMLKKMVIRNVSCEENTKISFESMLSICKERSIEQNTPRQRKDVNYVTTWLREFEWQQEEEHDELFKPNVHIFARLLTQRNLRIDDVWEEVYRNYYNYVGNHSKGAYIPQDLVNLLCQSFNFSAFVDVDALPDQGDSLALISLSNSTRDHWELKNHHDSHWDFTEHADKSTFKRYHDFSIELFNSENRELITEALQSTFKEKIKQVILSDEPYIEEMFTQLPSNNWANNGAVQGVVNYFVDIIVDDQNPYILQDKAKIYFKQTPEFRDFLTHFKQYYNLNTRLSHEETLTQLKQVLQSYPTPQERFMILSPVLRTMLKGHNTDANLTLQDLITLCRGFKLGLDLYFNKGNDSVYCFQRQIAFFKDSDNFATLSVVSANEGIQCLQDSNLFSYQNKFILAYPSHHAFVHEPNANLDETLQILKNGIASHLKKGILFVQTQPHNDAQRKVDIECKKAPPLHAAIIANDSEKVRRLLRKGTDWRAKHPWSVTDKNLVKDHKKVSPSVSALTLASSLDNPTITNLILPYANKGSDKALIQEAYNAAVNFKHSRVLYCYLPTDVTHSYHALLNAARHKDLFLVAALANRGAPLIQRNVSEAKLLALSLDIAQRNSDDINFSLAFHNLLLTLAHEQRLTGARFKKEAFKLDEKALKTVACAFDHSLGRWVQNVIEFNEKMPALYDKEKELRDISSSNFESLLEIVTKAACSAIEEADDLMLNECFVADQRCLIFPGKFNPLHSALSKEQYDFVFNTYVKYVQNKIKALQGELTVENKEEIEHNLKTQFKKMADIAYDEYDRTLSFRLERVNRKKDLQTRLVNSQSFWTSFKTRVAQIGFSLNQGRINVVDALHKKTKHTAKINNNTITKIGYPTMLAIRSLGTLHNGGVLRFGIDFTWSLMPSVVKYPFVKIAQKTGSLIGPYVGTTTETAASYSGILVDNIVSFALMPQFYVASTVLGNGVYFAFKDSGYDNLEAIAALAADGIAFNIASGGTNYEIDDRYIYQLTRNLTPFAGEWATTNYLVPVISTIDGFNIHLNNAIQYPISALSPYFSASTLSKISEAVGGPVLQLDNLSLPEALQALGNYANEGASYFQSLLKSKRAMEEQLFCYIESSALDYIKDSAYKNDRLHALQILKVSQISQCVDDQKKTVEQLQQSPEINKAELESAQATLKELTSTLEAAENVEDTLFKQTEGYPYFDAWQEKHVELKYAEVDRFVSQDELSALKIEVQLAKEQSIFYNNESTNRASQTWEKSVNDLFDKHRANFPDTTNLVGCFEKIVETTFSGFSDRNQMAKFAADEIIRIKYPFYPDIGDPAVIETERTHYINEISTDELSGYIRDRDRAMNRLYDYVAAKITNTEKPKHIHRFDRIVKPFVNEILGKTIGWVPFKDFKGGRSQIGNVGLQTNTQLGGGTTVDLTIAGTPLLSVFNTNKSKPELVLSDLNKISVANTPANLAQPSALEVDVEVSTNPALDIHNPIMVDILAEQFEKVFSSVNNIKIPEVEYISSSKSPAKNKPSEGHNPTARSQNAPAKRTNAPVVITPVTHSPKTTNPEQKQSWWRLAFRSALGEDSPEIRAWKRNNLKSTPKWLVNFTKGVSDSVIPIDELPEIFNVAAKESVIELIEGVVSLGHFAANEIGHVIKGEDLQTKKAISLLGVFIGEEAARVALKEQTQTSKYARELADTFDQLDKKERVKAIAKLAISIAVPIIGASKVTQVTKPVVQNMAVAAPVVSAGRYPLRSAGKSQQAKALSVNQVSKEHVDKLNTLLGTAAPKRGAQPALKLDPPAAKSIAPQYALRSRAPKQTTSIKHPTGFSAEGLTKIEVKNLMQSSSNLFTLEQKKTILKCLNKGGAERINLKIDNYGMVRLAMERDGHTSGFQRMSYKIGLNGDKSMIIQTAFDDSAKLVRQSLGASKNNLYDVKKKPVKK